MKFDARRTMRKCLALLFAVVVYYLVHEGAHAIYAAAIGRFDQIVFLFPGMQVKADTQNMTDLQIGVFCLVGAAATLTTAYALCLSAKRIARVRSHAIRAAAYYATLALLLTDPIYLSLLCGLFGGGDMNGIALLMPKTAARIVFGAIGAVNAFALIKFVVPIYRDAFRRHSEPQRREENDV